MTNIALYLRLAFATAVVLAPGWALARALGVRTVSATLAWSLAVLFAALSLTFLLQATLTVTLVVLLVVLPAAAAIRLLRTPTLETSVPGRWVTGGAGALLGVLLWSVAGSVQGDGLFHLGRVRKLVELDELSLKAVGEFADASLHPGYAFPLWHGCLGLVAKIAGTDPEQVVLHLPSILAPLAVLVAYEAGHALFQSRPAAVAVVAAQVGLIALAPGSGGAYNALALPATASRQLLVPAAIALFFAYLRDRSPTQLPAIAAAGLSLSLVHPTYAIFLAVPLGGYLVARGVMARGEFVPAGVAFIAFTAPLAAVAAALLPIVQKTVSHQPDSQVLQNAFEKYPKQLDVISGTSYRLAPEVFGRGGAIAIAALLVLPLAALVPLRRWSAFVLGGSLAVLTVTLTSALFPTFADLVSISQARRAAGFLPFAFAFAGGVLVLTSLLRFAVLPLALAAGIGLQLLFPGDFGYKLEDGGPAYVTWAAVLGGSLAFAIAAIIRWPGIHERAERVAGLAAILFVVPVGVHAATHWTTPERADKHALTPGLLQALRARTNERDIVFSDADTSYRIAAALPVYIATAPPPHVADTTENRPYERFADARLFLKTADLGIPRAYGADWIVVNRRRFKTPLKQAPVYEDEQYALYRP